MLKLLLIEMLWQYFIGSSSAHKALFNISRILLFMRAYNTIKCCILCVCVCVYIHTNTHTTHIQLKKLL